MVYTVFSSCYLYCFSPRGQKHIQEKQILMYEKGKEVETAVVSVKGYGIIPLEESNTLHTTLPGESLDIIPKPYDTVDQGCVRYSDRG